MDDYEMLVEKLNERMNSSKRPEVILAGLIAAAFIVLNNNKINYEDVADEVRELIKESEQNESFRLGYIVELLQANSMDVGNNG